MLFVIFVGCDFLEFRIMSKNVVEVNIEDLLDLVNIVGLNFIKDFVGVKFNGVNLCGVDLSGVNLYVVYLRGVDLSDVDLSEVNFS